MRFIDRPIDRVHQFSFPGEHDLHSGGSGLDLPPRLNKLLCRDCGQPVKGLECQREECRKKRQGGGA